MRMCVSGGGGRACIHMHTHALYIQCLLEVVVLNIHGIFIICQMLLKAASAKWAHTMPCCPLGVLQILGLRHRNARSHSQVSELKF